MKKTKVDLSKTDDNLLSIIAVAQDALIKDKRIKDNKIMSNEIFCGRVVSKEKVFAIIRKYCDII